MARKPDYSESHDKLFSRNNRQTRQTRWHGQEDDNADLKGHGKKERLFSQQARDRSWHRAQDTDVVPTTDGGVCDRVQHSTHHDIRTRRSEFSRKTLPKSQDNEAASRFVKYYSHKTSDQESLPLQSRFHNRKFADQTGRTYGEGGGKEFSKRTLQDSEAFDQETSRFDKYDSHKTSDQESLPMRSQFHNRFADQTGRTYGQGKKEFSKRTLSKSQDSEAFDQKASRFGKYHDQESLPLRSQFHNRRFVNQRDSEHIRGQRGNMSSEFQERPQHGSQDLQLPQTSSGYKATRRWRPKDAVDRCKDAPKPHPSQAHYNRQHYDSGKSRAFKENIQGKQSGREFGSHQNKPDRDKTWFDSVQSISPSSIIRLSQLPPERLVSELFNKVKALQTTLQRKVVLEKSGIMDAVIKMMSKVANTLNCSDALRHKACQILGEVLSERCATFQFQLKLYIRQYSKGSEDKIHVLCEFFYNLLLALPNSSWSVLPVDELNDLIKNDVRLDLTLGDKVRCLVELRDAARENNTKQRQEKSGMDEWDNSEFKDIPILPQWEEVCVAQAAPRLRKNIVMGGYSDWLHYYDIQFRLLREDFMAPLRNGICDYLRGSRGRKLKELRVYTTVLIREPVLSDIGVSFKIKIDVSRMRCNWSHSKRLIHGSLVCLSPDNFQEEIYFATIFERDAEKIAKGELQIIFQDTHEVLSFSCKDEAYFTMVESRAYFEASRHILHSLQTAEIDSMPFTKYLIKGECDSVELPQYLNNCYNMSYKLSFLLTQAEKSRLRENISISGDSTDSEDEFGTKLVRMRGGDHSYDVMNILNFAQWPSLDQIELDSSQLNALQMALTQEIAIIQGPPGTGKTYIGLKIVEALLINKDVWKSEGNKSPILVLCFTNHALDQFLEGILDCPCYKYSDPENIRLVRIGGRSQCERLIKYNLKYRRNNVHLPGEFLYAKFDAQDSVRDFRDSSSSLQNYFKSFHNFFHLKQIQEYMSPLHYSQLHSTAHTLEEYNFALELWLNLYQVFIPNEGNFVNEPEKSSPDMSSESLVIDQPLSSELTMDQAREKQAESEDCDLAHNSNPKNFDQDDNNFTEEDSDTESLIKVAGDADIEQADRIIDDYDLHNVREIQYDPNSTYNFDHRQPDLPKEDATEPEEGTTDSSYVKHEPVVIFNETAFNEVLSWGFPHIPMPKEAVDNISDIHDLSLDDRWRLYKYWHSQYVQSLCEECKEEFKVYNKLCSEQDEARKEADRYVLETADVIGMTTTGAAKYQHILHLVKPRIVIVEEAAEVLESHIVSALNAGTQHLILIGDHKQLRPKPNEFELAKKYKLDVSLFERLILNKFPRATLEIQHRMRPEIAQLVKPHIYETLINHSSVEQYENVRGASTNLFFIQHENPEQEDENLVSHSNEHEARYLAALCKYFLQQRYKPSEITILVTYTGQLLATRKLLPKIDFEGVRVSTVDNFQGEENDIILLSLVRSNQDNIVGFLREENRVCVSLSRARKGFYCIGNFKMLREVVPIWENIMSDMESKEKLGEGLLLQCSNHPQVNFIAKAPQDFIDNAPLGGCTKDCQFRLPCGHVCAQKCHYTDPDHANYKCKKPCVKKCPEGHPCPFPCYRTCKCNVKVKRIISGCNHEQEMLCYENPEHVQCTNPCKKKCSKNLHNCPLKCFERCQPCSFLEPVVMPSCGHIQQLKCSKDPSAVKCQANCSKTCKNGHPCPKRCHQFCGECTIRILKTIPECKHTVQLPCHVEPSHKKCTKPCERILPCDHMCQLLCGEDCSQQVCTRKVDIKLPQCGHEIKVTCETSKDPLSIFCHEKCKRSLPCGHYCGLKCGDPCKTECDIKVKKEWPCGHTLNRPCFQTATPEKYPCDQKCTRELECGHTCSKKCGELCDEKCMFKLSKQYPCGHMMEVPCASTPSEFPCKKICPCFLSCGHKCKGACSKCSLRSVHEPCDFNIQINRFCGHSLQVPCRGLQDAHPGKKMFIIYCSHGKVEKNCPIDKYHTCDQPCQWSCPHFTCTKSCPEICDRKACDERCDQRLKCGHQCYGLCGEPCLTWCPQCQLKKFNKALKEANNFESEYLYYELTCGHIFKVEYLDTYTQKVYNTKSNILVGPLQCPVKGCLQPLFSCSYRYGNAMKTSLSFVEDVFNSLATAQDEAKLIILDNETKIRIRLDDTCNSELYSELDVQSLHSELYIPFRESRQAIISAIRDARKEGMEYIKGDKLFVKYEPMPELSTTLYKLKKTMLIGLNELHSEEMFLIHIFLQALEYLNLAQHPDVPDSNAVLIKIKRFLRFLSSIISGQNRHLTCQTVQDLQSEVFRLCLQLQCLVTRASLVKEDMSILTDAESYLEHNTQVTRSNFQSHMVALTSCNNVITLDCAKIGCGDMNYTGILADMEKFYPKNLKGQWYRCKNSHYFCAPPSIIDNIAPECPECEGTYEFCNVQHGRPIAATIKQVSSNATPLAVSSKQPTAKAQKHQAVPSIPPKGFQTKQKQEHHRHGGGKKGGRRRRK